MLALATSNYEVSIDDLQSTLRLGAYFHYNISCISSLKKYDAFLLS